MKRFTLVLQSSHQYEEINDTVSFVGEDKTGSFGILAGHAKMMTILKYGLAWYKTEDAVVEYLALPGALLYFIDNKLMISTRHYLRNPDYHAMKQALEHELRREEEKLSSLKESLHQLDREIIQHLLDLKKKYRYGTE